MNLKVIATGSRGNSLILESEGRCLILDAGIRYSDILKGLGHDLSKVDGCLCGHEHYDHAKSASDFLANGCTVAMSRGTAKMIFDETDYLKEMATFIKAGDQIKIGDWTVLAFDVEHDAAEPLGFLIQNGTHKILYVTDTSSLKYKFVGLTAIIIECNYILESLDENSTNRFLTDRIKGSHLALETLIPWLQSIDRKHLSHIVLTHMSNSNGDENKSIEMVKHFTGIPCTVASAGQSIRLSQFDF